MAERIRGDIESPVHFEAQAVLGVNQVFDGGVWFHFTVDRPDLGMTYGGLHETSAGAEAAKNTEVRRTRRSHWSRIDKVTRQKNGFSRRQANALANEWDTKAVIRELKVGEVYHPWGEGYKSYTHGKDDGTHGSKKRKID